MKKTAKIIIVAMLLLGMLIPASFAWFKDFSRVDVGMNSFVHKSYFESGDGKTDAQFIDGTHGDDQTNCAFEIKWPIQLYYFAWLQYLGYFNQPIGDSNQIDQVYFYLSQDLDMTGWTLPPIGTREYPFVGNFDGNGHTITNLTVQNVTTSTNLNENVTMNDLPVSTVSNAEIIGFFGVVGSLIPEGTGAGTVNGACGTDNFVATPGYTYTSSINEIKNFTIDGVTINTETNQALIGAIAGYVNGTVSNTAVSDTDIVVDSEAGIMNFTENVSDYALVGYCTDPYKFTLNVSKVTLHAPGETQNLIYKNTQGEGAGFGGSIGMQTLFDRIYRVANPNANPTFGVLNHDYVVEETIKIDLHDDGIPRVIDSKTAKANTNSYYNRGVSFSGATDYYRYYYYSTNAAGSYYILHDITDYSTGTFLCLYGKNAQYTKTVTTYTYLDEFFDGFRISDGSTFLNVVPNGNSAEISTGTSAENATIWALDNDGHLNAIVEYDSTATTFFLNANTMTGAVSISTTASTVWTRSGEPNGTLSFSNGSTWYLYNFNGTWLSYPGTSVGTISQDGVYLRATSNTTVDGTTATDGSVWSIDASGHIYTYYNGANRYLVSNGSDITLSNSASMVWNQNNDGTITNGDGWYLIYSDGWKTLPTLSLVSVSSGTDYLSVDGTSVANSASAPAYWISDGDKLYTIIGTTAYYLRARATGLDLVTSSANGTAFSYDETNKMLSFTSGGTYYVVFDGTSWTVSSSTGGSGPISSGGSYLNANTTTVSLGSRANQATQWTCDQSTGKIYMTSGGTTYYLRGLLETTQTRSTTNLTVTSNANDSGTNWYYSGGQLSCNLTIDGNSTTYYLVLENNTWKLMDTSKTYYTIHPTSQNSGYYLTATNTATMNGNVNNENNATLWASSVVLGGSAATPTISTIINGQTYYLNIPTTGNQVALSLQLTPTTINYYHSRSGNNNANPCFYRVNGTTEYFINRTSRGWVAYSGYDDYAFMTLTNRSFTPASVTISGIVYKTEKLTDAIDANILFSVETIAQTISDAQQRQTYTKTVENNVRSGHSTYIPLTAEDANAPTPFAVKDSNTGYIVSGANLTTGGEAQTMSGDIRISKYPVSNISNSASGLSGNNNYTTTYDRRLEIITAVNYGDYNGFYRISDSYNRDNGNISSTLSNEVGNNRKISYTSLGLKRYEDCRKSISDLFLNQNKIYGLHFMDAQIDKNRCVILPEAIYDYQTKYNLPVPEDSIDFYVRRRGFITVFAGTYYTNNNAFFSLHEIVRYKEDDVEVINGEAQKDDIRYIKEISKIYKAEGSGDYIYEYTASSGGGYSSTSARGDLVFDMTWMTNPSTFVNNAVYYFEIPVNSGEFALGSVPGKTGAYLFYLDIAANAGSAEDKERVTVTEKIKDETYSVELPVGVQIVESGNQYDSNNPYDLATISLSSEFEGIYPLKRIGQYVSYKNDTNSELSFVGGTLTAKTTDNGNVVDYVYYPNGYVIEYIEHITDLGLLTENYDHILVKTVDNYSKVGILTSRNVYIYASIENGSSFSENENIDERLLDHIITFTYDPSGHENIRMRVVRAASDGGFNVAFNENVTLINTSITSEIADVHVNFGDTTGDLVTATATNPLNGRTITAINLDGTLGGDDNDEGLYYGSVYGPELATYISYYEGSGEGYSVTASTEISMDKLGPGTSNQNRSLAYAIELALGNNVDNVVVYGCRLIDSYQYSTKVFNNSTPPDGIASSGIVTVTVTGVTINDTELGSTMAKITINGN